MRRSPQRALLFSLLLVACSSKPAAVTQVTVVVASDLTTADDLRRVEVSVLSADGAREFDRASFELSESARAGALRLPFSFGVAKAGAARFRLRVSGHSAAPDPIVEAKTLVEFADNQSRLVQVFLARACLGVDCDDDMTCDVDAAKCGPIEPAQTEPLEPGRELNGVAGTGPSRAGGDAGVSDADAAAAPGEPSDAGGDSGGMAAPAGRGGSGSAGTAAEGGTGGSGADESDADAGMTLVEQQLEEELAGWINEQNIGIDATCACYRDLQYETRRDCQNAMGGSINAGRSSCIAQATQLAPAEALPVVRCKRKVFAAYADCLALNFVCPHIDEAQQCLSAFELGAQECPTFSDAVRAGVQDCSDVAQGFADYVAALHEDSSRVCRCWSALGYADLPACEQGESIVDAEYDMLESCFFSVDGAPGAQQGTRVSVRSYFSCDAQAYDRYKTCVDAVSLCAGDGASQCRNNYLIESEGCKTEAGFVVDPVSLCGQ